MGELGGTACPPGGVTHLWRNSNPPAAAQPPQRTWHARLSAADAKRDDAVLHVLPIGATQRQQRACRAGAPRGRAGVARAQSRAVRRTRRALDSLERCAPLLPP